MILRTNLATTPAKNYSLYLLGCLALTIFTVLFTLFNVAGLSSGYLEIQKLQSRIEEQQKRKIDSEQQASVLQSNIARIKTPQFVKETEFINNAIKRRVFSWTTLFDQFEKVLPENVKMVSIYPAITEDAININMETAGKSLNDIVKLILVLENSPVFAHVSFRSEHQEGDGLLHANITLEYLPEKAEAISRTGSTQTAVESQSDEGGKKE